MLSVSDVNTPMSPINPAEVLGLIHRNELDHTNSKVFDGDKHLKDDHKSYHSDN